MKITLRLPATSFAANEELSLEVAVLNDGPSPVEIPDPFNAFNWQPAYTITGPAYPSGFTFSFRSAVRKDPRPNPTGVDPTLIQLAAGEETVSEIPLSDWVKLLVPGRYQLVARLDWHGLQAVSNTVVFDIEAFTVVSAGLGVDVGAPSVREPWVGWLREGQGARVLGESIFQELRPDLGEMRRLSVHPAATVGAGATDVLPPFTNYDRKVQLTFWRAWREGTAVFALAAGAPQPESVDLGPLPLLVRPSLMTEKGELDVYALAGETNELLVARFRPGAPPRLARGAKLPGRFLSGRAALAPREAGSARHVVVTTVDDDGALLLHHVAAGGGEQLQAVTSISVPGVSPMLNARPGVHVGADGFARVAVLAETDPVERRFALVEVVFAPVPGNRPAPQVTDLGTLPRPAWSSGASFVMAPGAHDRVDWVVLLEGGDIVSSKSPAAAASTGVPLAFPLEIYSTAKAAYVLGLDPAEGPVFLLLR